MSLCCNRHTEIDTLLELRTLLFCPRTNVGQKRNQLLDCLVVVHVLTQRAAAISSTSVFGSVVDKQSRVDTMTNQKRRAVFLANKELVVQGS